MNGLIFQPRSRRPSSQHRGFNLVEAAIVLGVVGLVIGGIWVAASAVRDQMKMNQSLTGFMYYVNHVMTTYPASLMQNATLGDIDLTWWQGEVPPLPDGFSKSDPACCLGAAGPLDSYGHMVRGQFQPGAIIYMGLLWQSSERNFCARFLQFAYKNVIDVAMKRAGDGPTCGAPGPDKDYGYYYDNCCAGSTGVGWYLYLPN